MRSAQRRPSRSIAAINGRPVVEPRTGRPGNGAALFVTALPCVSDTETVSSTSRFGFRNTIRRSRVPHRPPTAPPYAPDVAARLDSMMPPGAPPIALFRTFVRNMPMTDGDARHGAATSSSKQLSLTMRDREVLIDRTCARLRM